MGRRRTFAGAGECRPRMPVGLLAHERRSETGTRARRPCRFGQRRRGRLPWRRFAGGACVSARAARRATTARRSRRHCSVVPGTGPACARGARIRGRGCEPHRPDPSALRHFRLRDFHQHRPQIHPRRPGAAARVLHAGRPACGTGAGTGSGRAYVFPQRAGAQGLRDGVMGQPSRSAHARLRRRAGSFRAA